MEVVIFQKKIISLKLDFFIPFKGIISVHIVSLKDHAI